MYTSNAVFRVFHQLSLSLTVAQLSKQRCIEHLIARGKSSNTLPKVVGFLRVLWLTPTKKLTGWVSINS